MLCMHSIMWCGDEYKDRVVFVIDLLTHTTMSIEVPLMPLIYTMLQEALLFNLQIMIQDLSILINAKDSTVGNEHVHDVLSTDQNQSLLP